jgi:hypothetical protein
MDATSDEAIIARYRETRGQFNLGVKSVGSTKKIKADTRKKVKPSLDTARMARRISGRREICGHVRIPNPTLSSDLGSPNKIFK